MSSLTVPSRWNVAILEEASPGSFGSVGGHASGVARNACQIFVRNLPFVFTWKMLKDKFNECGHVLYADIKMENGEPEGCGVVKFESPEVAQRARWMMNGVKLSV